MRFRFRFEKLLTVRKFEEDTVQNQLSVLKQELYKEQDKLKELYLLIEATNKKLSAILNSGKIDLNLINSYRNYSDKLSKDISVQKDVIIHLKNEVNNKREQLVEAVKKVKVLEKLKEKDKQKFMENLEYKENLFLEEIATNNYIRDKQNK
jgi:flagellar export protein FliJ